MSMKHTKPETETASGAPDPWNEKSNNDRAREARNESRAALRNAETAARRNDHAAAKKWAETAQRMADTAAQLAAMPLPETSQEEIVAIRLEILARMAKFMDVEAPGDDACAAGSAKEILEELASRAKR